MNTSIHTDISHNIYDTWYANDVIHDECWNNGLILFYHNGDIHKLTFYFVIMVMVKIFKCYALLKKQCIYSDWTENNQNGDFYSG